MSVVLNVNGTDYFYPQTGDINWGPDATDWAVAVTQGMLQKAGGLFQLLGEVDFGPNYGLKSIYYKSRSSNISSTGTLRLARTDVIGWRNNANDNDLLLSVDSSDQLLYNGSPIGTMTTVSDTNSIDLTITGTDLTADLNLSADTPDTGYQIVALSIETDGLKAQIADTAIQAAFSVSDTNSIDLTYSSGSISADLLLSAASPSVGYAEVELSIELDGLKAQAPVMVGDSGSGGVAGAVPAPSSGDASAGKFLKADGTWAVAGGGMTNPMTTTGDVIYSSSGSTPARLGIGSSGDVLTVAGGVPTWAAPSVGSGFTTPTTGSTYGNTTASGSLTGINNTAVGIDAGIAITSGAYNTLYGTEAGKAMVSGFSNTFIGPQAGLVSTNGSANTGIGRSVLVALTSGSDNVALGNSALNGVTTGSSNTALGRSTGQLWTGSANQNVAIGADSGSSGLPTNYSDTISIGYGANASANRAIAIGGGGTTAATGTNSITIGYYSRASDNGAIAIGSAVQSGHRSLAIGIQSVSSFPSTYTSTSANEQIAFGTPSFSFKDMFIGNGAVATATPNDVTVQPTPATGTNAAGADLTLLGGLSTGNAAGGDIFFKGSKPGSSGTSSNTQTNVFAVEAIGFIKSYGGIKRKTTSVTTTYTMDSGSTPDDILYCNTSGGAFTVTLPAVTDGRVIVIKDKGGSAGSNVITITPASGNIDGSGSAAISTNYGSLTLSCDGTNWWII